MTPSPSKPGASNTAHAAPEIVPLRSADPAERRDVTSRAADAIARGGLVIVATETSYALVGLACSAAAAARLRPAIHAGPREVRSAVWLAPTIDGDDGVEREIAGDDLAVGPFTAHRHRRIVERLAPGPAIFLAVAHGPALAATLHELGLPESAADDGERLAFRVSGQMSASAVAARVGKPLLSVELAAETAEEAVAAAGALGIAAAMVLDDGPIRLRAGATVILLREDGGHEVLREGAYEARYIDKQSERLVLFVCTGNTCRSPMAEAIARGVASRDESLRGVRFDSAGVGAGPGMPMTPDAADALREAGVAPGDHASKPLTRKLIAEADVIYAMTRSHAAAVLELDPGAGDKVRTLDPAGRDVPDPIGQGPEVYTETARRLVELISRRMKELQP